MNNKGNVSRRKFVANATVLVTAFGGLSEVAHFNIDREHLRPCQGKLCNRTAFNSECRSGAATVSPWRPFAGEGFNSRNLIYLW